MFKAELVTENGEQIIRVSLDGNVIHNFTIERAEGFVLEDAADYNLKTIVAGVLAGLPQVAPDAEATE